MKTFSQTHFILVPTVFHMYQVVVHYRESIRRERNGTVVVSLHKTYYVYASTSQESHVTLVTPGTRRVH